MHCPVCRKARGVKKFIYGDITHPIVIVWCKTCKQMFHTTIISPYICSKCGKPVIADITKYKIMGSRKVFHSRCPKKEG